MNEKNVKTVKKVKKEDLATKRILAVFVMAAVVLWGMSGLFDLMTSGTYYPVGRAINTGLIVVGAVASVVLLYLAVREKKQGTSNEEKILTTGFYALCALAVFVSNLLLKVDFFYGMHILYILLPVIAVLYLVFYVFERQFFSFCVAAAASITATYWCYTSVWERLPALLLAGVLCLVPMVMALVSGGKLQKLSEMVLGKQFDKRYTLLIYAAMILLMLCAALVQGKVALVIALAMGAYLLAAAVYYTIKAM